jgi:hypothetical protein
MSYEKYRTDEEFLLNTFQENDIAFIDGFREWIIRTRSETDMRNDSGTEMLAVRKQMINNFLKFIIRNGVLQKALLDIPEVKDTIMGSNADEYDKFCLAVYGLLPLQTPFVNKWYSRILYELVHNPDAFSLDDIEHIAAYNNKYISTRFVDKNKILTDDNMPNGFDIAPDYLQRDRLMEIVELGRLFKTDCPGFNDSELYYLTAGMAYINVLHKAPTDYATIVKEIARIIQINPLNIVINATCSMTDERACPNSMGRWSLVTHIRSDDNDNFRYMPALKYFKDYIKKDNTLTDFEQIGKKGADAYKTIRITTSYNKPQLDAVNKELSLMVERLMAKYKDDSSDELYIKDCIDIYAKFIDTQQYTRGTCIIGQIMLSYLMFYKQWIKHKKISVYVSNPNELPDWAACAGKCDESLFHVVSFDANHLTNIIKNVQVKTTTVLFQYRALINTYA